MSQGTESRLATWSVPQCLFTIEYVPRVLEEIRLTVIDAFFSLPRGGAEIGGLLLGRFASGRLTISGYQPVECEHAFGPSYVLSERDTARLEKALEGVAAQPDAPQPMGWYHSHTRSEIFLSEADREIHDRYFGKPWQVALVLRPHTFQPTRAGFFFREAGGRIHTENSYREFEILPPGSTPPAVLDAPAAKPASPSPIPPSAARPAPPPPPPPPQPTPRTGFLDAVAEIPVEIPAPPPGQPRRAAFLDSVLETPVEIPPLHLEPHQPLALLEAPDAPGEEHPAAEEAPPPAAAVEPPPAILEEEAPTPEDGLPRFLAADIPGRKRRWRPLTIFLVAAALGACGYVTRGFWWSMATSAVHSVMPAGRPAPLKLRVLDTNGQLQIQWDANSPALRDVKSARLIINDGPKLRNLTLDAAHLTSGALTYARETGRVEVALQVTPAYGEPFREQTSYLGHGPPAAPAPPDADTARQLDDLERQNQQLKNDLDKERARGKKLDREAQYLREQRDRDLRQKRQEKQPIDK